jgi:hypothetical protein
MSRFQFNRKYRDAKSFATIGEWRRWWRALLPFPQRNHGDDARRPRGQQVHDRKKFCDERGQQQQVKTDRPCRQHESHQVDRLVYKWQWTKNKLQAIGGHRHDERENDPGARQFWRAQLRLHLFGKFHRLAGSSLNATREKRDGFPPGAIPATAGFPFAPDGSIIAGSEENKISQITWPNFSSDSIPARKA